jgi:hypothetical protein
MRTRGEQQKSNTTTHPKETKTWALSCYLTSLPARNCFAELYLSSLPFLAEVSDKGMNYGWCIQH